MLLIQVLSPGDCLKLLQPFQRLRQFCVNAFIRLTENRVHLFSLKTNVRLPYLRSRSQSHSYIVYFSFLFFISFGSICTFFPRNSLLRCFCSCSIERRRMKEGKSPNKLLLYVVYDMQFTHFTFYLHLDFNFRWWSVRNSTLEVYVFNSSIGIYDDSWCTVPLLWDFLVTVTKSLHVWWW